MTVPIVHAAAAAAGRGLGKDLLVGIFGAVSWIESLCPGAPMLDMQRGGALAERLLEKAGWLAEGRRVERVERWAYQLMVSGVEGR